MKKKSTAVIIDARGIRNISNAIQSVLEIREHVKQLFIISPSYRRNRAFYANWEEDKTVLERDMPIQIVAKLDESQLGCDYVLHVHPFLNLTRGGFELLKSQAARSGAARTKHALRSVVDLSQHKFSYNHGFLLVLCVLEFLWNIWEWGKFSRTIDARMDAVIKLGAYKRIAKKSFFDRILNFRQTRVLHEHGTAIVEPPSSGNKFTEHVLKYHQSLGLGFWILGIFGFVTFVALPFFTSLLSSFDGTNLFQWFLFIMSVFWLSQAISSFLITRTRYYVPFSLVHAFLFPINACLFIVYVFYSRRQ